jgi:hypothetical protein
MTMNRRLTDDQLARRLTAYAQLRLSPTPDATARMRARVMEAAVSVAAAGIPAHPAARAQEPIRLAAYRMTFGGRSRAFAARMAAALSVLLLGGVAFASSPGGPLYGVRLWVETVSLPSEPGARADADVPRLDARLDEAVGAARNGNGSGTAAALAAYREILEDALTAAGQPDSRSERLETALARHQLVLARLLGFVPEPARDALERAIERSDKAVEGIGAGAGGNGNNAGNGKDRPVIRPTPRVPNEHRPSLKPKDSSDRPQGAGGGKSN